jgi:arylsulfatase A-like enzyme
MVVGAMAGFLGALSDIASTVLWLAPGPDRWRLVVVYVLAGVGMGGVLAGVAWACDRVVARWVDNATVRHGVLVCVPMGVVGHLLFAGGKMRRLPVQWLLQPLAAFVLIALAAMVLTRLARWAKRATSMSPWQRRGWAAATLLLAWMLHGVDHRVFPRLYEHLHLVLGVSTFIAFATTVWSLGAPWLLSRTRTPWLPIVVSLCAAIVSWSLLQSWPNVRAEVFGTHSPFIRHGALALASVTRAPESRDLDPVALRRARLARETIHSTTTGPSFPNAHVLLITVDALRADRLGRLVNGRSLTPTLDTLAQHGVVFTRAYAQAPHSSYSLSSLHTGEYLHETIPLGQAQPLTTLADAMRTAGRDTVALYTRGIFFTEAEQLTAYRDRDFGFARASHVERNADAMVVAVSQELDDIARRGEPRSFVWAHFFDAHAPYQGSGNTPMEQYDNAVSRVDAAIGRVLEHARRTLARDMIVAVTADHGEEFGEHGGVYHGSTLYEEQVRVPLVIAVPGMPARTVQTPVELVDVAPTLCALAGVSVATSMRGDDLRIGMTQGDLSGTPIFSSVNSRAMVRRGDWKLVSDITYGVYELFDLSSDPTERRNLAATESVRVDALRADMHAWIEALTARSSHEGPLARARLGDRTCVPELLALLAEGRASEHDRTEAVRLVAGFGRRDVVPTLLRALNDESVHVRDEAAIALGMMNNRAGIQSLRAMATADPPTLRHRAGLALARLHDPLAFDVLVELLSSANETEAHDAVLALGSSQNPNAYEALMAHYPDDHLRYRIVLALGMLGDVRALSTLAHTAWTDPTDDARANAFAALGRLGDARAIPMLLRALTQTPPERYAAEALGALGVIGPWLDGFDARNAETTPVGFEHCDSHEDTLGWRYLNAHSCVAKSSRFVTVTFLSRSSGRRALVIRARRDNGPPVHATVRVAQHVIGTLTLTPRWEEVRLPAQLDTGDVSVVFDLGNSHAELHVDHIISLAAR